MTLTDKIEFKSEIELEHDGAGATMSFDPLEEFDEFQQKIIQGEAVIWEQLNVQFKVSKEFKLRVRKIPIYTGLA